MLCISARRWQPDTVRLEVSLTPQAEPTRRESGVHPQV